MLMVCFTNTYRLNVDGVFKVIVSKKLYLFGILTQEKMVVSTQPKMKTQKRQLKKRQLKKKTTQKEKQLS